MQPPPSAATGYANFGHPKSTSGHMWMLFPPPPPGALSNSFLRPGAKAGGGWGLQPLPPGPKNILLKGGKRAFYSLNESEDFFFFFAFRPSVGVISRITRHLIAPLSEILTTPLYAHPWHNFTDTTFCFIAKRWLRDTVKSHVICHIMRY